MRKNKNIAIGLFWTISFIILYRLFTLDYQNGVADLLFTFLFHIPLLVVVTINICLIDQFFLEKKKTKYLLGLFALLPLGIWLFHLVFGPLSKWLSPYYYISLYFSNWELTQYILVYLTVSFLVIIAVNWFFIKEQQVLLEQENNKANLQLLKAQLNPHFLFNSLNNIYSLTGTQSDAGKYILKLSDSLRYMTYETEETFVPLDNELDYIRNYFDLEKLKISKNKKVNLSISGDSSRHLIAPLLFLPFVENCFKHCNRSSPKIDVTISVHSNHVHLTSKNGLSENYFQKGGLGIDNIKKRLELIYHGHYKLEMNLVDAMYNVELLINLDIHEN